MSWSTSIIGRAGALATRVAEDFKKVQGCPAGSPEEAAKNKLGEIAADLCAHVLDPGTVLKIDANGSAWNTADGKHNSIYTKFEISTIGTFVE